MGYWTVDQVLEYYSEGTHYERGHNIQKSNEWELIYNCGDTKFYSTIKSDGTKTLLLVLKHKQGWYGLIPSKEQFKALTETFPKIYKQVEEYNKDAKAGKFALF